MPIREKILSAFSTTGEYSPVLPFKTSGYVDGLFHVSMLAGAAKLLDDAPIQMLAEGWVKQLLQLGDIRNWVTDDTGAVIVEDDTAQSFAGPCALAWAIQCGCDLPNPYTTIRKQALWIYAASPFVFALGRYVSAIQQHVNSAMLACLLLKKRPACADWLLEGNAFYSAIAGKELAVPDLTIQKAEDTEASASSVSLEDREGSAWIWKQSPYKKATSRVTTYEYTPTALYVALALQSNL